MTIKPVQSVMVESRAQYQYASTVLQFPQQMGPHGMLMVFKKYDFMSPGRRGLLKIADAPPSTASQTIRGGILLPIPASLVDSNSVKIVGDNLDKVTEDLAASLAGDRDNLIRSTLGGIYDTVTLNNTAGNLSYLARKIFDRTETEGGISTGLGNAINTKAALIFNGMDLKEYTYEWTLAPTHKTESDELSNIVRLLKKNILPAYGEKSDTHTRFMLEYPSTVDLFLLGVDQNHFFRYKTAMIKNMNINYTPNGLSLLRGGKPAVVNLSMSFIEMDIHASGDYEGYGAASDSGAY